MDECVDGLAYLLIAKSKVILSYHSKEETSKKVQKKTFFPSLPKIKRQGTVKYRY